MTESDGSFVDESQRDGGSNVGDFTPKSESVNPILTRVRDSGSGDEEDEDSDAQDEEKINTVVEEKRRSSEKDSEVDEVIKLKELKPNDDETQSFDKRISTFQTFKTLEDMNVDFPSKRGSKIDISEEVIKK